MRLNNRSALFAAVRSNDIQTLQASLSSDRKLLRADGTDFHLLRMCIEYNRGQMIEFLLELGCRASLPSYIGDSPLHLVVVKRNCCGLLTKLLNNGANVNAKNRWNETPIEVAFMAQADDNVIEALLKAHLKDSTANESNSSGLSYLHIACASAHLNYVKKLVEDGGADVNAQVDLDGQYSLAGCTPLHMAVEYRNYEVMDYLLNHGADLHLPDAEGSTPIHLALELGEAKIIEILFDHEESRFNYKNKYGLSHFMAACACGDLESVEDMLAYRSDGDNWFDINEMVNCTDKEYYPLNGFTPLHFAASFGHMLTVKWLLQDGANCFTNTHLNLTPIQLAEQYGHQEIAEYIRAHCQGYNRRTEN